MSIQSMSPESSQQGRDALVGGLTVRGGGDILACGFGMTVAAWISAYITRMPVFSSPAPGQVTIFLMLMMVFIGGFLAARYSARGIMAAVLAGAVSGVLDILVAGSILHDVSGGTATAPASAPVAAVAPAAGLWIFGSIVLNTVVATCGGGLGVLLPARNRANIRWSAVFAVILAAATLPLITAGGLVTAFGVGMAVPDWPQSYGYNMFLFPLSKMQSAQGNFYEHAHRLMGSLVGLTSLAAAIYFTIAEKRNAVKIFAWVIFAAVCVQGLMGGLRVTENSIPLATLHGIFAQVVFASMVCLAAASTRSFVNVGDRVMPPGAADRFYSGSLLVAMLIQLSLAALVRQRVDVLVLVHIMMAAGVAMLALLCGFRAYVLHAEIMPLRRTGLAVLCFVCLQLMLGVIALAVRRGPDDPPNVPSAFWTTIHQVNGALLLSSCALLCLWSWRLLDGRDPVLEGIELPA